MPTTKADFSHNEARRVAPSVQQIGHTAVAELRDSIALASYRDGSLAEGVLTQGQFRGDVEAASIGRDGGVAPSSVRSRILIVEDDPPLARFLSRTLGAASHDLEIANDGATALRSLSPALDLVLLDRNLPDGDGLSVLRTLRASYPKLPVLMLTACASTEDTVLGLDSGADDYLTKPFSYVELLARVGALLRRNSIALPQIASVADLTLFREEHRVERGGRRIDLTPREFCLLEYLMRSPGTPVPRATLMSAVWNISDPSSNVVDVYMKYLRDKIDGNEEIRLVRTIRGVGFVVSDS